MRMKATLGDRLYLPSPAEAFDGVTYNPSQDYARMNLQQHRVFKLMSDGQWRTLAQIAEGKFSEAGASARLRDLRKARYGSHTIRRRRVLEDGRKGGLWEYRLEINNASSS